MPKYVSIPLRVIGIILCVILAFLLVCNIIIVVKGSMDDTKPPSVFGVTPMVVLSNSMSSSIHEYDGFTGLIPVPSNGPGENNAFAGIWDNPDYPGLVCTKTDDQFTDVHSAKDCVNVHTERDSIYIKGHEVSGKKCNESHIEMDDLVFIDNSDPSTLKVGDVISFMEGKIVVTHRIVNIITLEDGTRGFVTAGDNNPSTSGDMTIDTEIVKEENVIGKYSCRIGGIGGLILFMQEPVGMICFIGIPLLAFIVYDIIRRQRAANRDNKKNAEMEAELERLRALAGEKATEEKAEEAPADK